MKKLTHNKGFTLIELIIVIAILAILMLIAIPAMTQYLKEAKAATARTNIKTIENNLVYAINTVEISAVKDRLFIGEIYKNPSADELKILNHLNEVLPESMLGKFAIMVEADGRAGPIGDYYIYYSYDKKLVWNDEGYAYHKGDRIDEVVEGNMGLPTGT